MSGVVTYSALTCVVTPDMSSHHITLCLEKSNHFRFAEAKHSFIYPLASELYQSHSNNSWVGYLDVHDSIILSCESWRPFCHYLIGNGKEVRWCWRSSLSSRISWLKVQHNVDYYVSKKFPKFSNIVSSYLTHSSSSHITSHYTHFSLLRITSSPS